MQDLLITGTDGFIGQILKQYFEKEGFRVFGTTFFREAGPNEVKFNIEKEEEMAKLPDRSFDVVVHTIALIDDSKWPKKQVFNVNAGGTQKMVEWAKQHGVKHFIQISSVSIYGYRVLGQDIPETRHRNQGIFGRPYMKSKAQGERIVEQSQLGYTILRLPPLVGPNDSFLTPAIMPKVLEGKFYFVGKKDRNFSTLYVRNLGPMISALIQKGPTNTVFHAMDYLVPWREFIREYGRQLGIDIPNHTKSILKCLKGLMDNSEAMLITYSAIGASYNTERLVKIIGLENMTRFKWQDGVREAIDAFFKKYPEKNVLKEMPQK